MDQWVGQRGPVEKGQEKDGGQCGGKYFMFWLSYPIHRSSTVRIIGIHLIRDKNTIH